MMPFHAWKDQQVKKDSAAAGVGLKFRPREWYYTAYGHYCQQQRKTNHEK